MRRACASSPISSPASSTTTRAMRKPKRPAPLSPERAANPPFRSSGMARALISTSPAAPASTGGGEHCGSRCSISGSMPAWNDNNEFGFSNEDAVCAGFGEPMPLDLARPLEPLLMTRASLDEQRRLAPLERQFTRHPRGHARHSALCADLERRQPHELALAQVGLAHRTANVDVRHVQYRARHRRLFRTRARPRASRALDASGIAASAFSHEFLEAGWGLSPRPGSIPKQRPRSARRSACATA